MAFTIEQPSNSYLHIEGDIPLDITEGTFISVTRKPPLKINSLGFQPAKTIPEIPRWFLQKYATMPVTVLEPFAGSGTTIIEALKHGSSVYWLDYNPLSRLICRVKTTNFSPTKVLEETSKIISDAKGTFKVPETVKFANKDFWFQKPVQEGLEILKEHILKAETRIQPLLWLAFASTVRKTSDMNDGMLLAARRSHIEEIPQRDRSDVFRYFQHYVEKAIDAVVEWNAVYQKVLDNSQELDLQDAKNITGSFKCDAIITSPPYINAIDYVWAAKFELHWLGMVKSDEDRLNLYSREIGTERIPREECKELGETGNQRLDSLIEDIYTGRKYKATRGQNELRARVVYKYFIDMRKHFESCFSHLHSRGYYCFSIGDVSRICGVDIPVASILTELACEVGFREEFHFHLLLKNRRLNLPRNVDWAGTIKHDTTVILAKPTL
ncbi:MULTISPECIES: DNA methylase [Cyanophyceae]|uniref:DNA methylase n=1 Tax=Cyanophyceae TaxID=3028117 RepID=UPI0016883410|nr:DNA methylase [Trichocoleus sp. FACHB-40]MBD2003722.1 DNA methylase [Trichocoleus sp. FACHB-40]